MTRARLRDLSEGELLARLFPLFGDIEGSVPVLLGPGDDAAVLAAPSGGVVLTTDSMVRDRDWRDDWSSAREVGQKVVAQNLADIAAMGAVPTGLLLALAADPETELDWVLDLASGIAEAAVAELDEWRAQRDNEAVKRSLDELRRVARSSDNIMPASIDLAHAGGTTGEWAAVLREEFGEYRAPIGVAAAAGAGGGSDGLPAGR